MTLTDTSTFDQLAAPYDRGMALLERLWLREMRTRLVPKAQGRVLEIGIGTGANLPFYGPNTHLTAIDESPEMLRAAIGRSAALGHRARISQAKAEHLPFPANTFDTVVTTLVLCSVIDPVCAFSEIRRVLRNPSGLLLLLEHTRPDTRPLSWLADWLNIPWYALQGRCHLNRRTQTMLVQNGFEIEHIETKLNGLFRLLVARPVVTRQEAALQDPAYENPLP